MGAETLREAAKILRERAKGATPGPWSPEPEYDRSVWSEVIENADVVEMGTAGSVSDLRYIATMHPCVGVALADLLETLADDRDAGFEIDGRTWDHNIVPLARLILGGTS